MTKSELVTYVSTATGIPCDTAWEAVTATVDAIIDAVGNGDKVAIPGFGTFRSRLREERTGRNPKTGEEITLPACKVPVFRSGSRMRAAARNS